MSATARVPAPRWQVVKDRARPRWKKLAAQTLAYADVHAPDGTRCCVKIVRNGPLTGTSQLTNGSPDPMSLLSYLPVNLLTQGQTGWRIDVVTPEEPFRRTTTLYSQPIQARLIVIDVAQIIVAPIARGDHLWDELTHP